MKKSLLWIFVFVLIVSIVTIGATNATPTIKYGGTITIVGVGQGSVPLNFNPFTPVGAGMEFTTVIYQSLFYVDAITGETYPLLATSYEWTDNNLELVVNLRRGVEWTDGTPFTSKDVAFTFNFMKENPASNLEGVWGSTTGLQTVEASGTNTVIFKFSTPDVPLLYYISQVPIVPEHIWAKIKDPLTTTDPNPIGTGPIIFQSYNPANDTFVAVKNPNYWMKGRPYLDKFVYNASPLSPTAVIEIMLKHEADYTYTFFPNVKKVWADKDPSINKYWYPTTNTNLLYFNTQKYPFNNPVFRKAIDLAINKEPFRQKAEAGISGMGNPTAIIPGQQKEWLDPTLTSLASSLNTYNPSESLKLLESIGFKKNQSGQLRSPDGKVLPAFSLIMPTETDFITMADMIAADLKVIGINVTVNTMPWNTFTASRDTGEYDMMICWASGWGPTPYYLYNGEFNPAYSATKIGESVVSDYGRYTNPLITAALNVYSETSDLRLQKQAMYTIERIVLQDVPFAVLTNRTDNYEYSEATLTGWPSASDPYNSLSVDVLMYVNVHLK
ncbi:MAG: ABC transporter substrate-binding protein [Thermotogae bacterium]|jgi:peptide/nickel transport system substrate-binding protein|nr:ABC transporter substrate-binding protein [Thermotogota bacterium]